MLSAAVRLQLAEPQAAGIYSHHHLMGLTNTPSDLLPGTLELLILKAIARGPKHGYGIVEHLRVSSADVLQVGESALYPALQRLLLNGWAKAEWGASENNRRARYYTLTSAGRKQLSAERAEFDRMIGAILRVLEAT
jgi:PadR family transcriptional regulator PadR